MGSVGRRSQPNECEPENAKQGLIVVVIVVCFQGEEASCQVGQQEEEEEEEEAVGRCDRSTDGG